MGIIEDEINNAESITLDLERALKAKAVYHPELKVIAQIGKDDGDNFHFKRMFNYMCNEAGDDNDKLQKLNGNLKYLVNFPKIQGFFMETFGGYNKI